MKRANVSTYSREYRLSMDEVKEAIKFYMEDKGIIYTAKTDVFIHDDNEELACEILMVDKRNVIIEPLHG